MSKKCNLIACLICLILTFVCLVSCGPIQVSPEQAAKRQAETDVQEVLGKIVWDDADREAITSNLSFPTENRNYPGVHMEWQTSEQDVISNEGKVTLLYDNDPRAYKLRPDDEEDTTKVIKVIVTVNVYAEYTWEDNGSHSATTDKLTKQFEFTVFAMPEDTDQGTIKEVKDRAWNFFYVENEVSKNLSTYDAKKYSVFVKGIVVGKLNAESKGFFVYDGTDTIYVYGSNSSYQVGSKVQVFGQVYIYYGNLQIGSKVSASFTTDIDVELPEAERITPTKWEEQTKGLSDEVIGRFGGRALEVEGLLYQEYNESTKDEYKLVDPLTGEVSWVYYKSYDKNMEAELAGYVGKYVALSGISYARDSRANKNQLLWTGGIEEAEEPVVDDETKANVTLSQITLKDSYDEDFDLNAAGSWEVVSGTGIEIVDGVAKVTLANGKQTVTLKVTVTVGEVSVSKEFTIVIPSLEIVVTSLEKAAEIGSQNPNYTTEKYYIEGVITEIVKEEYGNMYISDGVNSFYVYGVYIGGKKYGEADVKPVVGQVVLLQGVLGAYKDAPQMKNADLIAYEYATEHSTVNNKVADQLGVANPSYTAEKYNIKGIVTEVKNTTYGNLYVQDLYGNKLYVYGLYSYDGSLRYDAMEKAPQVGDFVVISGALGAYNGAAQMKNGWLLQLNEENYAEVETPKEPLEENKAYKLELVQPNAGKTVYFTGAMAEYYYATSEDSAAGVDVYAEKVDGGYNLYFLDAEGTKHYMGIVVSGTHVNAVFDNEKTVFVYDEVYKTVVVALNDSVYTFGTRNDKTYTTIGANDLAKAPFVAYLVDLDAEAPEHEHKFVDGKCECGEVDPNYQPPVVEPSDSEYEVVSELKENVAYKFGVVQGNVNKTLFLTGNYKNTYYGEATTELKDAADVYLIKVEGGYNIKLVQTNGTVLYINVIASGTHTNIKFEAAASSVWNYNAELNTLTTLVNDTEFYIGTYDNYETISPSNISHAATSFVGHFYGKLEGETPEPPVHEHKYVDGKCECGAEDPNYVKPETKELTIAEALELADGAEVIIKGTVDSVEAWSDQFNNMNFTLKDTTGELYVFRCSTKVALGDIVTLTGVMGSYYGTRQVAQGSTCEITGHDDSYDKVDSESVTITFEDKAKRTVLTSSQQVWVENGITVTNDQASSTTPVADYANPARFYAGSKLTVKSEKAFTTITFKTNSKHFNANFKVEGATVSVSGSTCVIVFAEAVDTFEIASLPYQIRVNYITLE